MVAKKRKRDAPRRPSKRGRAEGMSLEDWKLQKTGSSKPAEHNNRGVAAPNTHKETRECLIL